MLAPIGQSLISAYDWRFALLTFAGIGVLMAVLALAIRAQPAGRGAAALVALDGLSLGQMLRTASGHRGFIAMTIAFFACDFQLVFFTTHLAPFLDLCGLPGSVSATALGPIGLFNAIGT